jgi:hypothetical protein
VLVATLIVAYGTVVVVGLPVLERSRPTAPLAKWLAANSGDAPIGAYLLDDWRASIRYYSDRPVVQIKTPEALVEFFDRAPDAYVLMLDREYHALRRSGVELHEVGGRPAIVGRTGKYFRRQVWGRLVIVTRNGRTKLPLAPPFT